MKIGSSRCLRKNSSKFGVQIAVMRQVLNAIRAHRDKQGPSAKNFSQDIVQRCVSRNKIVHRFVHNESQGQIARAKEENEDNVQGPREKVFTQDSRSHNSRPFNNNRKNAAQCAYVVPRL
jgi:hypothetical protein